MIRNSHVTFDRVEKSDGDIAQLITERQAAGQCFKVAEENGAVVGFASYAQFRNGIGYAHAMEHTIILAPAAQQKGFGRLLMDKMEEHGRAAGAHSMIAGVSGHNCEGIDFHLALGYQPIAVVPQVGRKFDIWLDLHLMQKFL